MLVAVLAISNGATVHESRQLPSWLIFDVRQKMKALVYFAVLLTCGCASSKSTHRPTPSDTLPKSRSVFESAAISPASTHDNSYLEFLRKDTGAARILQVSDGGAFGGSILLTLTDALLTVEYFDEQGRRKESKRLGADVAAVAWAKIVALDVPSWRRRYVPEDITPGLQIFDGTQWSVTFCDATRGAFSSGSNVYPALSPLGTPTLDTPGRYDTSNAYRELFSLLMKLKEPNKALEPTTTAVTSPAAQEPRQP